MHLRQIYKTLTNSKLKRKRKSAVYTIRTRETDSIAVPTFLLMGLGALFFVIQGVAISNIPLVVTNSITFLCSAVIFGIKVYNDHFRGRGKRRE